MIRIAEEYLQQNDGDAVEAAKEFTYALARGAAVPEDVGARRFTLDFAIEAAVDAFQLGLPDVVSLVWAIAADTYAGIRSPVGESRRVQ